ncbi:MAG: hypothetical protein WCQ47_01155 [bacterium]
MAVKKRNRRSGQAMIETIFMLPFIIAVLFFIYQSYTLINKVESVQKYLKGGAVGLLMNRNVISSENYHLTTTKTNQEVPKDGKYFVVYNDNSATGQASSKFMKVNLDDITINMLLYFCPSESKSAIRSYLKSQQSQQALGVCIGGYTKMGDQVSGAVLGMGEGETCLNK